MNFNWKTYVQNYEDLRKAGINNERKAKTHWEIYGKKEGRTFQKFTNIVTSKNSNISNELIKEKKDTVNHSYNWEKYILSLKEKMDNTSKENFDWESYKKLYPNLLDLNKQDDCWNHWSNIGKNENKICVNILNDDAYNLFDYELYKYLYPEFTNFNKVEAFTHWINYGFFEKRVCNFEKEYISKSNLGEYFKINNRIFSNQQKILNEVKRHSNHFDVDIFFFKKAHDLNINDNEILYHISNVGIKEGLIYHPKQLKNIFPDIKIYSDELKIYVKYNEKYYNIVTFLRDELYNKDCNWYLSQIEQKDTKLRNENLVLLIFIGNSTVGNKLLLDIINYKQKDKFILSVCFKNNDIYEELKKIIFDNFDNYALFITKEYGNDIMPTMLMYNLLNKQVSFELIIKLHTKSDKIWSDTLTEFLLTKSSAELDTIFEKYCCCVGPPRYTLTERPVLGIFSNHKVLDLYKNFIKGNNFIGGTMFYCRKYVFDTIMQIINIDFKMFFNNNLYDTNMINFTNSPPHALERLFGFVK
jgi:hypothetical protein